MTSESRELIALSGKARPRLIMILNDFRQGQRVTRARREATASYVRPARLAGFASYAANRLPRVLHRLKTQPPDLETVKASSRSGISTGSPRSLLEVLDDD